MSETQSSSPPRPDTVRLQRLSKGFWESAILMAAVELGLFTAIERGQNQVASAAAAMGISELNAERLLTAANALELLFSAKAEVAECAVAATGEAMKLYGGSGYRAGGALERGIRDVHAAHALSPTTDILRTWTGRSLMGLPILGD